MDLNLKVDNEIEIPGTALLRLFKEMNENGGIAAVATSNVYLYCKSDKQQLAAMLLPACDCDECTELKEEIKNMIRTDTLDKEHIKKVIDLFIKNHP